MAIALDVALLVDMVAARGDYFHVQRKLCIGKRDAIENDFQITFADKVPRLLFRFKVSAHVRSARKDIVTKHLHRGEVAEHRIAHLCRS